MKCIAGSTFVVHESSLGAGAKLSIARSSQARHPCRLPLPSPVAWWLTASLIVVAAMLGCTPPIRQYDIKDEKLSCEDANRFAHETLVGMSFEVTRIEPAAPGRIGTLRGKRRVGVEGKKTQSAVVTIECTGAGASVDAREEGKVLGQLDFKRAFFISFTSVRQMAARRAETEARMAAGSLPPSVQRRDVRVLLEPIVGEAAKLDFGFDLHGGGVLPLRLQVDNLTQRSYRLDPGEIRLARSDRSRVTAISVEDAAARVAAARDAKTGQPLTTLSREEIAAKLSANLFVARRLAPGTQAQGFLYFPAGEYRNGRVVLTEEESEETEGVVVEF